MGLFLNIRSWALFLLMLGPSLSLRLLANFVEISGTIFDIATLLFTIMYFGWVWAVANSANKKLGVELRLPITRMTIGLAYAGLYCIFVVIFFPFGSETGRGLPNIIIPAHLFAMFAIFYSFLVAARRFVVLQKQRQVVFSDYGASFFLFWAFPIGIWVIQPKVNKFLGSRNA